METSQVPSHNVQQSFPVYDTRAHAYLCGHYELAQAMCFDAYAVRMQVLKEKHWSEKARENMTARDWRIFREDHRIAYKNGGQNAPMPFRSWDEMPLPGDLRRAIDDLGYTKPSPIQMASIPFGIRQRDVIGIAETGSGKTAAFVLPMLMYIMNQPVMTDAIAADGPYALILAPTRELAQQIEEETNGLAKHTGAVSLATPPPPPSSMYVCTIIPCLSLLQVSCMVDGGVVPGLPQPGLSACC